MVGYSGPTAKRVEQTKRYFVFGSGGGSNEQRGNAVLIS